jgi:hypothetical protein
MQGSAKESSDRRILLRDSSTLSALDKLLFVKAVDDSSTRFV